MSRSSKSTHNFKIVLAGDASTGKSSIVLRITEHVFESLPPTIGCDFKKHEVTSSNGDTVNLIMWDTAGEEKYQSIMSSYYRGAHAVILVYDVMNRASFEHIESIWLDQVDMYCTRGSDHCVLMLLANKIDLAEKSDRSVSVEEGLALAQKAGMIFGECSTKCDKGINEAMVALVDRLLEVNANAQQISTGIKLKQYDQDEINDDNSGACGC